MPGSDVHDHGQLSSRAVRAHSHIHHHPAAAPHPAQAAPWSIIRMTLLARLGAALAVSAGLWAIVLIAMR
jgi:hypothetical protein